jgi:hypothetical protein
MIKKEKEKTTLQRSPYMYYVTNWGFVEQPTKPEQKQNQKR